MNVCMHVSSHYAICAWPKTVNLKIKLCSVLFCSVLTILISVCFKNAPFLCVELSHLKLRLRSLQGRIVILGPGYKQETLSFVNLMHFNPIPRSLYLLISTES